MCALILFTHFDCIFLFQFCVSVVVLVVSLNWNLCAHHIWMSESGKESETDALNDFTLLCILNALNFLQLIYFAFCECDYDIKKIHTHQERTDSTSEWKFVVNQKKQSSFKLHWSLERLFSFGVVVISINKHKWWVIYFHKQILNIHLHSLHSVAAVCACESVSLAFCFINFDSRVNLSHNHFSLT